jgi:hypothetical protein
VETLGREQGALRAAVRLLIWCGSLFLVFGTAAVVVVSAVAYQPDNLDAVGEAARVGYDLLWLEPMVVTASVAFWILAALLVLIGQRSRASS